MMRSMLYAGALVLLSFTAFSQEGVYEISEYDMSSLTEMILIEHKDSVQANNKLLIYIHNKDSVQIGKQLYSNIKGLRTVKKFVSNMGTSPDMSENPGKATIVLDFKKEPDMLLGTAFLKELKSAYYDIRNSISQLVYGKRYVLLSLDERKNIDTKCPYRVILAYVPGLHYHKATNNLVLR